MTVGNLGRYIALLAWHKMVDGPAGVAGALARGLRGVLTAGTLDTLGRCFDHAELNALVAGLAQLDLPAWRAATRYEGCGPATPQASPPVLAAPSRHGFSPLVAADGVPASACGTHSCLMSTLLQVGWLWAALARAAAPTRAQLLSFVTGSATLPAGGFAMLRGFNGSLHPFTGELNVVGCRRMRRAGALPAEQPSIGAWAGPTTPPRNLKLPLPPHRLPAASCPDNSYSVTCKFSASCMPPTRQ